MSGSRIIGVRNRNDATYKSKVGAGNFARAMDLVPLPEVIGTLAGYDSVATPFECDSDAYSESFAICLIACSGKVTARAHQHRVTDGHEPK